MAFYHFYCNSADLLRCDAGSGCGESRNRLQTDLHLCVVVCVCIRGYMYVCM